MEQLGVAETFNVVLNVPTLRSEESRAVLEHLNVLAPSDVDAALAMLDTAMPVKRLLMLVEMAAHKHNTAAGVHVPIDRFLQCVEELAGGGGF